MSELSQSAVPRAVISRTSLASGAVKAVAAAPRGGVADLRRDAWGHGLIMVAQALRAAGAAGALVDSEADVALLREHGLHAATTGEPDLDPHLLYGLPDAQGVLRADPVMRVTGRVLSTKPIAAGGGVSYGYTHRASEDSTLALVVGGYAQGIVRALGNHAHVDIHGVRMPIVGRIAMDVCVVDVGDTEVAPGDVATYFGGWGSTRTELALWSEIAGLTVAELVSVVGQKCVREEED
ncbi:alanine racemase [Microbacterium keratanolyticum]|uniref:Alanine racemase C-terminal domain-containing protein n=1 Tax=Microbacterium keratanolyticum TaxID=67574 RepID=A0A9W6HUA9_9MICO|nr:alanine racemase C-terminal domain-containing protein [Microbacterium keratanolyticum]MBM7467511.1 alanine racemase [Microbacterium keratanolyticum]GLK02500.1 hypothetical protein GCM10017596_22150 [Microbacterium keratanolyticum]